MRLNSIQKDLAESIGEVLAGVSKSTSKKPAVIYINFVEAERTEIRLWLITEQDQISIPLQISNPTDILDTTLAFTKTLENPQSLSSEYLPIAQRLYDWIILPIRSKLESQQVNELVFLVDSSLRSIPFSAFHDGEEFLIENYSIGLMPGLTLTNTQYVNPKDMSVLGLGISKPSNDTGWPALPFVEKELSTIKEIWPGDYFLNENATLETISNYRTKHQIIHLATHGNFDTASSEGFLVFWDSVVSLDKLNILGLNTPLPVELLVLSACRTGIGGEFSKFGLAGEAIKSGAKSVLSSLWLIDDSATASLMSEFYVKLQSSSDNPTPTKAEALRKAQLAFINAEDIIFSSSSDQGISETTRAIATNVTTAPQTPPDPTTIAHPYYWAGFTMIGSPW